MNSAKHTSRRSFLNIGARAAAAISLSEVLSPISLSAASPNRAVVCIYLLGGNDSNNMIVPLDSPAYDAYARGRGSLALAKDSLLAVQSGPSDAYGFHPNLPGLRDLYNQNALAVVANVGFRTLALLFSAGRLSGDSVGGAGHRRFGTTAGAGLAAQRDPGGAGRIPGAVSRSGRVRRHGSYTRLIAVHRIGRAVEHGPGRIEDGLL